MWSHRAPLKLRAIHSYKCSGWWFKDTVMIPLTLSVCRQKLFVTDILCPPVAVETEDNSSIHPYFVLIRSCWCLVYCDEKLWYTFHFPLCLRVHVFSLFWTPTSCGIVLFAFTPLVNMAIGFTHGIKHRPMQKTHVKRNISTLTWSLCCWGCFKSCADTKKRNSFFNIQDHLSD